MTGTRDGYVYAIQPIGMDVVKIGCTHKPRDRAEVLASFSPVPMKFRHLLQVPSFYAATAFEQYVLGWSRDGGGFGEWRSDLMLVDDLFACIAPAVDVSGEYEIPVKNPVKGSRISDDLLAERLMIADFHASFPGGDIEARKAVGLSEYFTPITSKYRGKAFDWLSANRPDVAAQYQGVAS